MISYPSLLVHSMQIFKHGGKKKIKKKIQDKDLVFKHTGFFFFFKKKQQQQQKSSSSRARKAALDLLGPPEFGADASAVLDTAQETKADRRLLLAASAETRARSLRVPRLLPPAKEGERLASERPRQPRPLEAAAQRPRSNATRRSPQHAAPRLGPPAPACGAPPRPIARCAAARGSRRSGAEALPRGRRGTRGSGSRRPRRRGRGAQPRATDGAPHSAGPASALSRSCDITARSRRPCSTLATTTMPARKRRKFEPDSPSFGS